MSSYNSIYVWCMGSHFTHSVTFPKLLWLILISHVLIIDEFKKCWCIQCPERLIRVCPIISKVRVTADMQVT